MSDRSSGVRDEEAVNPWASACCIAMLAVGAILTFAVDWHIPGVNVDLVGLIMMAVGADRLSAYVSIFKRRRPQPPRPGRPVVVEEERHHLD